jgi:Zn finger protein HypA/HybF involved in hydrogenase expression
MSKKLDLNEVKRRLHNKKIELLSEYVSLQEKLKVKCLKCNHIWDPHASNVLGKYGCPRCARNSKLNNEIVDERIKKYSILRLDDYINNQHKIKFMCLACNKKWWSAPSNIMAGHGCPKCKHEIGAKKQRKSLEEVDSILNNKNLTRLSDYLGVEHKIKCKCRICNTKFIRSTQSLLEKTGCPVCRCYYKRQTYVKDTIMAEFSNIQVNKRFNIPQLVYVDFYIPKIKTIVEYNGEQHYKPVKFKGKNDNDATRRLQKQKKRDRQLRKYCSKNNIKLIELPYWLSDEEINKNIRNLRNQKLSI